jgi:hypothetical protein
MRFLSWRRYSNLEFATHKEVSLAPSRGLWMGYEVNSQFRIWLIRTNVGTSESSSGLLRVSKCEVSGSTLRFLKSNVESIFNDEMICAPSRFREGVKMWDFRFKTKISEFNFSIQVHFWNDLFTKCGLRMWTIQSSIRLIRYLKGSVYGFWCEAYSIV